MENTHEPANDMDLDTLVKSVEETVEFSAHYDAPYSFCLSCCVARSKNLMYSGICVYCLAEKRYCVRGNHDENHDAFVRKNGDESLCCNKCRGDDEESADSQSDGSGEMNLKLGIMKDNQVSRENESHTNTESQVHDTINTYTRPSVDEGLSLPATLSVEIDQLLDIRPQVDIQSHPDIETHTGMEAAYDMGAAYDMEAYPDMGAYPNMEAPHDMEAPRDMEDHLDMAAHLDMEGHPEMKPSLSYKWPSEPEMIVRGSQFENELPLIPGAHYVKEESVIEAPLGVEARPDIEAEFGMERTEILPKLDIRPPSSMETHQDVKRVFEVKQEPMDTIDFSKIPSFGFASVQDRGNKWSPIIIDD
ncbi:hypothetical protein N7454_009671 [Penicillium verhagenii]|nr:hypothetical protein N7454_009671 [Penicillium verhagenii]